MGEAAGRWRGEGGGGGAARGLGGAEAVVVALLPCRLEVGVVVVEVPWTLSPSNIT